MSEKPNRIPRHIIPNFKIYFKLILNPALNDSFKFMRFAISMPSKIESMIEEIGLFSNPRRSLPIKSLATKPIVATIKHNRRPGILLNI